jgi:hypothetical protein
MVVRADYSTKGDEIMGWREQLDAAIAKIREAAESEQARDMAAKARTTATNLVQRLREGAVGAAEAFVEANEDPSALKVRLHNADINIVSPSDDISVTRPDAASLVISDGQGNGLVVNAAVSPAFVAQMIGSVKPLGGNSFDIGAEDGINVVVIKG